MKTHIKALMRVVPEEDGGRHGPFGAGYRPHLVAKDSDFWLAVTVVNLEAGRLIYPGDEVTLEMELDYPTQVDYSSLCRGAKFSMREGSKTIAVGAIL
ncbi:MAG: hypothetical protein H7X97_10890 [Opitutaceae bacterium]|nr:hypothetical protein [Verrucomicrobiales bacterium]